MKKHIPNRETRLAEDFLAELQNHKIRSSLQLFREDKQWIAYDPITDIASSGPTKAKAKAALKEAIKVFKKTMRA